MCLAGWFWDGRVGGQELLLAGSWDHGPRALRRQGILRPQMQDCYHLPSTMCDCTSSPALSEVVQATAQPPQGVAHVKPDDDHPQNFQEKRPGSLTEWLKDPGHCRERWTLCGQTLGILLSWPLAATLAWLCLLGAQGHLRLLGWLLAVAVIALTIALFTLYVLRTGSAAIESCSRSGGTPTRRCI
ncbi:E3 ubiquitin-protein ligase MARCHF2 isoform X3 [Manis javanica]|uniref:E3 ubiquitin-protein ligase MARCHF2 isoform X3 n=1 Tax=Manis javanica TaxID=9974 RepID=UPI003C6CEB8A